MIHVLDKDSLGKFNIYFEHREFACKCEHSDCGRTLYNERTIAALYSVRMHYGEPLAISSGFRCQRHNHDVSGKDNSFHRIGTAVDLYLPSDPILKQKLIDIVSCYADWFYVGEGFIHFDMRNIL